MFKLIFLTILLAVSSTHAFWAACPGIPAPTSVTSPVCSGATCSVTRGQAFNAQAVVSFAGAFTGLQTRVTIFVLGVGANVPQPNPNTCDFLTPSCPTTPGAATTWNIAMTVSSVAPITSNARLRFEILNGGTAVACADVTAQITA